MGATDPNTATSPAPVQEKSVGKRLRGLFKKSPSDTALPNSLSTQDNNGREAIPKRAASVATSLTSSEASTAASTAPAESNTAANTAKTHSTDRVNEPQIWQLALEDFKTTNPKLFERTSTLFNDCIDDTPEGAIIQPPNHATFAFERIEALQADRAALHQTSAKFRKVFEDTVTLLLKVKDAIALAAAANPYASAAFTAVGLLLPLALVSSEENEMAVNGLNLVTVLITEYRWREKSYLSSDAAGDFTAAARKIYVAIYEYEAELYDHLQHNKLRRLGSNIYNAGRWSEKIDQLKTLDAGCRKLTDAIAEVRAVQWRSEEQRWQDLLLNQPRLEAEKANRRHLYCAYEKAKNVNPIRVSGTLEWFLKHPKFLGWRASQSSEFLWLVHDPGCGKSVLSKCLVDQKADFSTINTELPLVCYFFFRDEEFNLTNAAAAIRSYLHQLLIQKPDLYKHMARDFEEKSTAFLEDFEALWSIFTAICRDPEVQEIVVILDALDQCESSDNVLNDQRRRLASSLAQLFESLRNSHDHESTPIRKFFVTSRPEIDIEREFRQITLHDSSIRLNGDEQVDWLQREVDVVVSQRLRLLATKMQLTARVREALSIRLSAMEHRSYLWVTLVFEFLESQVEISARNVPKLLAEMPKSIDQAYANLLSKVRDADRTRQLLQYVIAATKPLSLSDLNVLMNIDEECTSIADLELWPELAVESNIRSISGLLVTTIDSHVHLIHQTVRKFLTRDLVDAMKSRFDIHTSNPWTEVLDPQASALALMQACIQFLSMDFTDKRSTERVYLQRGVRPRTGSADVKLFKYASTQWVRHFSTAAQMVPRELSIHIAETLFNSSRSVFKLWLAQYVQNAAESTTRYRPRDGNGLMWAAFFGFNSIVEHLIMEIEDVDLTDAFGRSALSFAANNGHTEAVRCLLANGAVCDAQDWVKQTPLIVALQHHHHEIAKMLLAAGASAKHIDVFGRTVSSYCDSKMVQMFSQSNRDDLNDDNNPGKTISAPINSTEGSFQSVSNYVEAYITKQHESKIWQSVAEDAPLRNMKTPKSTGLSTLYDNIVSAVELLELQDGGDRSSEARDHVLTALAAIPAIIETESPFFLCYVPRILAYLYTHKHFHLVSAIFSRLSEQSMRVLESGHPVVLMLSHISKLLLDHGLSLDAHKLVTTIFSTVITSWSTLLGPSHAQVIYATHVFHTCQSWFSDPATLIPSLTSLADAAITAQGPASYAALQIRVDLAQMQFSASNFSEAQKIAIDACEQVVLSFDSLSTTQSRDPVKPFDMAHLKNQLTVPGTYKPQIRLLPQNFRMIHLFLEALRTSAEAKFRLGQAAEAEDEYREVLLTSSSLLGVMHSRTKQHRRSLAQFLRRVGKEDEAESIAYNY